MASCFFPLYNIIILTNNDLIYTQKYNLIIRFGALFWRKDNFVGLNKTLHNRTVMPAFIKRLVLRSSSSINYNFSAHFLEF